MEEIGTGGTASVYIAKDCLIGCRWAVKVVDRKSVYFCELIKEMNITAELSHPSIPRITSFIRDHRRGYFIMDLIEGRNLREYIISEGRLDIDKSRQLSETLCSALEHIHNKGYLYLDLKPENIIITESGHFFIIDFGSVKRKDDRSLKLYGTPAYAAPEQLRGGHVDERTDIYAFGMVMREVCCEKAVSAIKPILKKCLYIKARRRFLNISQLYKALNRRNYFEKNSKLRKVAGICTIVLIMIFSFIAFAQDSSDKALKDNNRELCILGSKLFDEGDFEGAADAFSDAVITGSKEAVPWFMNSCIAADDLQRFIAFFDDNGLAEDHNMLFMAVPVYIAAGDKKARQYVAELRHDSTYESRLAEFDFLLDIQELWDGFIDEKLIRELFGRLSDIKDEKVFAEYAYIFLRLLYERKSELSGAEEFAIAIAGIFEDNSKNNKTMNAMFTAKALMTCGDIIFEEALAKGDYKKADIMDAVKYYEKGREICLSNDKSALEKEIQAVNICFESTQNEEDRKEAANVLKELYGEGFETFGSIIYGCRLGLIYAEFYNDFDNAEDICMRFAAVEADVTIEEAELLKRLREICLQRGIGDS